MNASEVKDLRKRTAERFGKGVQCGFGDHFDRLEGSLESAERKLADSMVSESRKEMSQRRYDAAQACIVEIELASTEAAVYAAFEKANL